MSSDTTARPFILQELADGIATLTLNLPEQRNPISGPAMIEALCDAIEAADADMSARVVIVTGAKACVTRQVMVRLSLVPGNCGKKSA